MSSDNLKRMKVIVKSCTNSLQIVIWDFVKLITNKPNDNIFTDFSVISLNHLNVFRSSSQIFLLTVYLSTFEKYYLFLLFLIFIVELIYQNFKFIIQSVMTFAIWVSSSIQI
jgi:hypothetical protein